MRNLDWTAPDPNNRAYYDDIVDDVSLRLSLLYASWGDANFQQNDTSASLLTKSVVITSAYLQDLTYKIFTQGKYFADPAILGAATITGPAWPASGLISGTDLLNALNLSRNRILQRYPAQIRIPAEGMLFSAADSLLSAWLTAAHSALALMTIPMICDNRVKRASSYSVNSGYQNSVADAVSDLNSQYQTVPLNPYLTSQSFGERGYQQINVEAYENYDENHNEITVYKAHAQALHIVIPEFLQYKGLAPTPYLIVSTAAGDDSYLSGFWSAFTGVTAAGTYKLTLTSPYDICKTITATIPAPEIDETVYYGSRYCLMLFLDYTGLL